MGRPARKTVSPGPPSDLVARFEELLLTWPLREARGEVVIPADEDPQTREQRYGNRQHKERKELLHRTLQALLCRGKVDGARIYNALAVARTEYLRVQSEQFNTNLVRKLNATRTSVHHRLKRALDDALAYFHAIGYDIPRPVWSGELPPLLFHVQQLAHLLDEARSANVLTRPLSPSVRAFKRPQGARPDKAWERRAHAELKRLGVPLRHRNSLLQAVGLQPLF